MNLFAVVSQTPFCCLECHPSRPHWYLALIGTDPFRQNQHCGGVLLDYALAQCDRDGVPAYLEATSRGNVALYLRHGFEVCGTIQVDSSPVLTPMIRPSCGTGR